MGEWIAKYWLQVLFGAIASGLLCWIRHDIKLYKLQLKNYRNDFKQEIKTELEAEIVQTKKELQKTDQQFNADLEQIHIELENLSVGLLSIQGKAFKADCHRLLQKDHIITLEEYEELVDDHKAYNALGGNHKGDELFKLVQIKYQAQVAR